MISKEFNENKLIISELKDIKTKSGLEINILDISYLNGENEAWSLYLTLPTIETYGPYPKSLYGYTITYSNENAAKLFKNIQKILSKKCKDYIQKINMKPVFSKNKKEINTAYFKLKMNDDDITTQYFTDKEQNKTIELLFQNMDW